MAGLAWAGALECKRLWLLKKSLFLETAKILGIENIQEKRDRRL
jgi:hypothetical protein